MKRLVAVAVLLVLVIGFAVTITPPRAQAGVKDSLIEVVVKVVLKRLAGDRNMTDDELRQQVEDWVNAGIDYAADPDRIHNNVAGHCWRLYANAMYGPNSNLFYYDGFVPYEFLTGDDWQQLATCQRAGYVPVTSRPTSSPVPQ